MLAAHKVDEHRVDAFEADGAVFDDGGDSIGGKEGIGKAEHGQAATGRAVHQIEFCPQNGGQRAFAADQRASHVEATLGQQLIEVIAGDAAGNLREASANLVGVSIANLPHPRVNLPFPSATRDDCMQIFVAGCADGHACAVSELHIERTDVVGRESAHHAVRSAGIVADHAADGAARMRRGIGREGQVVHFRGFPHAIEDDAWLDDGRFALRVERQQAPHVLREVNDDRDIAALAGEAGSGATRQDSRAQFAAGGDGRLHIGFIARQHDAHRRLPVIGGVGGVQGTRSGIKADFSADGGAQFGFEFARRGKGFVRVFRVVQNVQRRVAHHNSLRR
jgi:hypothetical protein